MTDSNRLLVLVASPRREGNSATLARAVVQGAESAGTRVALRFADDYLSTFLRDCRQCRRDDGECSITDRYRELFFEDFLPSRGLILCTPIYWYGLSAQAKAFFDRMFCYYTASYPTSNDVGTRLAGKRIGLVLAAEETYPGAGLGIIHEIQEYATYTHSDFVGVVRGVGNSRGEVARDPGGSMAEAERLGREILSRPHSNYRMDTVRPGQIWPPESGPT